MDGVAVSRTRDRLTAAILAFIVLGAVAAFLTLMIGLIDVTHVNSPNVITKRNR